MKFLKRFNWKKTLFILYSIGFILYGGSKGFHVTWDETLENGAWVDEETGLTHNATYVSNTVVHITWVAKYGDVQLADPVYVYARELSSTNDADWVQISDDGLTVGDLSFTLEGNNLTNYMYYVHTEYVPPSPVVTNGVYHLSGFDAPQTNRFISLKVQIIADGETIAPISGSDAITIETTEEGAGNE